MCASTTMASLKFPLQDPPQQVASNTATISIKLICFNNWMDLSNNAMSRDQGSSQTTKVLGHSTRCLLACNCAKELASCGAVSAHQRHIVSCQNGMRLQSESPADTFLQRNMQPTFRDTKMSNALNFFVPSWREKSKSFSCQVI